MSRVYVVQLPAGDAGDLSLRARRVLESASLLLATDPDATRARLTDLGIDAPVSAVDTAPTTLPEEDAVALIVDGLGVGADEGVRRTVGCALAAGLPVEPVPGPALPLTALVVSGLPADSFVYLGALRSNDPDCEELLRSVTAERRTLVALADGGEVASLVTDLHAVLGDRTLVVVRAGSRGGGVWRGSLAAAIDARESLPVGECALVLAGKTEEPVAWDEVLLTGEIERRVARGEGAKEISQALVDVSGWSRREIYRRATELTGTRPDW